MKKIHFLFLLALIIVLIASGIFFLRQKENSTEQPLHQDQPESISSVTTPPDWQVASFGYGGVIDEKTTSLPSIELSHPQSVTLRNLTTNPPSYQLFQHGPKQTEFTELYDALSIVIEFRDRQNPEISLQDEITQNLEKNEIPEIVEPLTAITINEQAGYTYTTRGLGTFTSYAFSTSDPEVYVIITDASADYEGDTFAKLTKEIIETVKIY